GPLRPCDGRRRAHDPWLLAGGLVRSDGRADRAARGGREEVDIPYRGRALITALLAAGLATWGTVARAQDLEPRAYANTPVGLNFLIAGYAFSEGGVATDPSLPLKDGSLNVHGAILAYARSLDVWRRSGKVDVVLPYAWASGSAVAFGRRRQRDVNGFGDPRIRFSLNFYGAPALSLEEFAAYHQ